MPAIATERTEGLSATESASATNGTPFGPSGAAEPGRHSMSIALRRRLIVAVAATAIVLVSLGYAYLITRDVATPDRLTTLAVLPFKPLVVNSRDEALELGMADTLIGRLGAIDGLTVRPLASVRRYHDPEQSPFDAGIALGVEAVLEGHIHRASGRIRVSARLLRLSDQRQLWAGRYDEDFTSIFAVQDAVAERVAQQLSLELAAPGTRSAGRNTVDTAAYDLYLRGRFFMSLAQPKNAIQMFEEAAKRDPGFALPLAGLADIYSRLPIATDGPSREPAQRARSSALRALEIDERLGEAFAALGWIGFYFDWNWSASELNFRKALELDASDFSAHLGYAHLLANTHRVDEALRAIDRALTIDSRSPIAATLKGQFLFHARRHDEARHQLISTLQSSPAFWIARVHLGRIHLHDGRFGDAIEAFEGGRGAGGSWTPLALIGYTHAVAGRTAEARRVLEELTSASRVSYVPPYHLAVVHAGLRETDLVMHWLERGIEERDVRMVFLGVDPLWDPIRGDARFAALVQRLKLAPGMATAKAATAVPR